MQTSLWMNLDFEQACFAWLETRRPHVAAKTAYEYRLIIKTLARFFGGMKLADITADLIRKYQRERQAQGMGASTINHETSCLQQILKRIGHWGDIGGDFSPLPLPKWQPGRIISADEKSRLFQVGMSNPDWLAGYLFAMISVNTTAGPKEVATLRLMDASLEERLILVQPEGAKRPERVRPIPLNEEALNAVKLALQRAQELGCSEPDDYIFPYRYRGTKKYDPRRFQRTFRSAWAKMTQAAKLEGLKMYDLRRTAITNLLGDPRVSEETVRKICGHVGSQMLKFYSYRRIDNMREALERIGKKPAKKVSQAVTHTVEIPVDKNPVEERQLRETLRKLLGITA